MLKARILATLVGVLFAGLANANPSIRFTTEDFPPSISNGTAKLSGPARIKFMKS